MALGDYMGAQCHACIGGTSVREDMRKLESGQHIVVGTPGRVYDMISRKVLRYGKLDFDMKNTFCFLISTIPIFFHG